jgi:ribulose-bisphosphate carboxylase large chain
VVPSASASIRATFELEPTGSATALALMESTGMEGGPGFVQGRVISDEGGRAVVEFPAENWGQNVPLLVSAVVAGEASEAAEFTRCRLVGLDLPERFLPGPAEGAQPSIVVGVIVKPSLGLSPAEVADVVAAATAGRASFVKDDELMGDPSWCPLEERVRAVAAVLPPGVVYCANVTGPIGTLLDRARRAVDAGATGLMVNAVAQGIDSVLALRQLELGVPILVHRAGSGPWCRNDRFGLSGAVLTRLLRLCGADYVIVGAFDGKLFDSDGEVRANLHAAREPLEGVRPSWAVMGGGLGPDNAAAQVRAAGGQGLVVVLGSRAYRHPGGVESAVRATREALG